MIVNQNIVELSFSEYRKQLLNLASQNLNPVLSKRITPEGVVQETLIAACERIHYFENNPEVPVYFKLRKLLFQTITSLERTHLQCKKRDICNELYIEDNAGYSTAQLNWNMFADSLTSPSLKASREERQELVKNMLNSLSENDRQIIELRNFDGMTNSECAEVLKITPKTASIRYVRALQRLKTQLQEISEFANNE